MLERLWQVVKFKFGLVGSLCAARGCAERIVPGAGPPHSTFFSVAGANAGGLVSSGVGRGAPRLRLVANHRLGGNHRCCGRDSDRDAAFDGTARRTPKPRHSGHWASDLELRGMGW